MRNPHIGPVSWDYSHLGRRLAQYTRTRNLSGASQPCFRFSKDVKQLNNFGWGKGRGCGEIWALERQGGFQARAYAPR